MSIPLIAQISRKNDGAFALFDDNDGRGSMRSVADHAARDSIIADMRKQGMLVYTDDDGFLWQLGADLTTWTQFTAGGGAVATTGDIILAVSTTGTDTTTPITSGDHSGTPFLTVDGALNVLPLFNGFNVIIEIGPGTFAKWTPRAFAGGGTVRFVGTGATAILDSGVATGTAGAGTQLNGDGSATIVKPTAAANWIVGELRGLFVTIIGGTGVATDPNTYVIGVIGENTTTTATIGVLFVAGETIDRSSVSNIDDTSVFEFMTLATVISPVLDAGDTAQMTLSGAANATALELLDFTGDGGETDSVLDFVSSSSVQVIGCNFHCLATECGAIVASNTPLYLFASYVDGGIFFNANECPIAYGWGNVGDHGLAFVANYCANASGFSNFVDLDSSTHGDASLWEATGCANFSEGGSHVSNCPHSILRLTACGSVSIFTSFVITGTNPRYGMEVKGPSSLLVYDKSLTAALGDVLLEDTVVSLLSAATGDVFIRGICQIEYAGS